MCSYVENVRRTIIRFPERGKTIHKKNYLSSQHAFPAYEQSPVCTVRAEFTYDEGHSFITPVLHLSLYHQHLIHVARHQIENRITENLINW
jgi:hypothetical protein